jgi:hypothetical protein
MSSRDCLERLEKHDHSITDVIRSARKSDPELVEKLDMEWGGFLQAMEDYLEEMRKTIER